MGGNTLITSHALPFLHILIILLILINSVSSITDDDDDSNNNNNNNTTSPSPSPAPAPSAHFVPYIPADNYLLNCGSPNDTNLVDGRMFKSDSATMAYLQTNDDFKASVDSIPSKLLPNSSVPPSSLPLFQSARIFTSVAKFTLRISNPGRHWVRLYLYPLPHSQCSPSSSVFSVAAGGSILLHEFSMKQNSSPEFKEYLIDVPSDQLTITFTPKFSCAFVNALEVVSAPNNLISDEASEIPTGTFAGLSKFSLQVSHRLNIGGPIITPENDTLSRTWIPDTLYNVFPQGARNVSVSPDIISFPESGGANPYIAPRTVYSTAEQMADSETSTQNFNLTWKLPVDPGFSYLIRLHFCDIVSKSLDDLYFNVYINEFVGDGPIDLSSVDRALDTAYYKDFVVGHGSIDNGSIMVQVGPDVETRSGQINAILNGLEVIKMSHWDGSLDGIVGVSGLIGRDVAWKIIAGIGLGIAVTGLLLIGLIMLRWEKRPKGWEKKKSFSSWLLPLHRRSSQFSISSSKKSSIFSTNSGLGKFFSFSELQTATQNFEETAILGVGGFGKVYLGVLEDGTKVAIKRGTPGSAQGMNEFQTEIQLLSKLRHRHLVSLIGFSDEQSEMILVYEYMSNGPLRDHLYGKAKQGTLSWKQRLEICIGSARGLHYLHTGSSEAIIHRDVKTTNILLDENLVAKVADFGLSKAAPMDRSPVSTAVKGSFGYLDPEYFRRQQLTDKSDVYSFGVLLFEVLCARPVLNPILPREEVNLGEWAMSCYRRGTLEKIIDPEIKGSIDKESLNKFVEAAEKCLSEYGVDRPAMGDVLWNLEYALQLQNASSSSSSSSVKKKSEENDDEANLIGCVGKKMEESGGGGGVVDDDSQVIGGISTIIPNFGEMEGR